MGLIDFILTLASLLLWVNWRTVPLDPLNNATPATLVGTLRRAEPTRWRRWHFLVALLALLGLRAEFYHLLGPALNWTATLNVFTTRLAFRCDVRELMLLYSVLSFGLALGELLLGFLLLTLLGRGQESTWAVRMARQQLGFIGDLPAHVKLVLPFISGAALWWLFSWLFSRWGLIAVPRTEAIRLAQAGLFGLGCYLPWKYLMLLLLGVHLLHNHIYFGPQPIWGVTDYVARQLLRPLRPLRLRMGKMDFAPLIGMVMVVSFAHVLEHGVKSPTKRDANGRTEHPRYEIPGIAGIYERISR